VKTASPIAVDAVVSFSGSARAASFIARMLAAIRAGSSLVAER